MLLQILVTGFSHRKVSNRPASNVNRFSIGLGIAFLAMISVFSVSGYLPTEVMYLYSGMSLITFLAYAHDKTKAQQGHWRTKESHLHLLALLGGWPGAALAQQILRHKSKKRQFRRVFWVSVIVNCAVFGWLNCHFLFA